jgi:hypothetical protein
MSIGVSLASLGFKGGGGTIAAPSAPAGLATEAYFRAIKISWAQTANAAYFRVNRATNESGTYALIADNVTALSYIDTGAKEDTPYWYYVVAVNAGGLSSNSSVISGRSNIAPAQSFSSDVIDNEVLEWSGLQNWFANTESVINGLDNSNVADYANIAASKVLGTAVCQSAVSAQIEKATATIPRHDQNGSIWLLGASQFKSAPGTYIYADYAKGALVFSDDSADWAYVNASGWHNGTPSSGTVTQKISIYFDTTRTAWVIEIDAVECGYIDPYVAPHPCVNTLTGVRTPAIGDAYLMLEATMFSFFYNNVNIGGIASTGVS